MTSGCSTQTERERYLTLQILCFCLYFVIALAPFIFYKIQGIEKLHEDFLKDPDDDDDEWARQESSYSIGWDRSYNLQRIQLV